MTIRKGEPWGVRAPFPADGVVVRSDAEARAVVTAARRAGEAVPPLGLLGGDLCRTLGGRGDEGRIRGEEAVELPVDLGEVLADGRLHWFVAHLQARRGWWTGRVIVAMNAQYLGDWDVAPRGHPNDGKLDVLDGDPGLRERWQVRGRLSTGSHLPHPAIQARHVPAIQLELPRSTPVLLDGEPVGACRDLSIRLEPDALRCWV